MASLIVYKHGWTSIQTFDDLVIRSLNRNKHLFPSLEKYLEYLCNKDYFPYGWMDISYQMEGLFCETPAVIEAIDMTGKRYTQLPFTFIGTSSQWDYTGLPRYCGEPPDVYHYTPRLYDYCYWINVDTRCIVKINVETKRWMSDYV